MVRHPLPGAVLAVAATTVGVVCWNDAGRARPTAIILVAAVMATACAARADPWPVRAGVVVMLLGIVAGARAESAWEGLTPRAVGGFAGWATVVGDPQPVRSAVRVVLEVDGQRFEYWARSRAKQSRVDAWRSGDRVFVTGSRAALDDERAGRVAWQHVVGELTIDWFGDRAAGGPLGRASNRVRATIERGASTLDPDQGALFRGLVVGDDRDQPPEMVERFRVSGLSHLTAVSGQNVAFVLAAAGPLLRRLRAGWRWAATVALIAWFVALTRFEPSIMRAGVMAGLSATAFALGRQRAPARLLCVAVTLLLLIDPLLSHSIGFWLSVGATAGVTTIGPWLAARLDRLGMLALPLGISLGAQVGVAVPALLVFGRLALVSVPANLLAVPVAGLVMLYGLPAGIVAGAFPPLAPVVMFPCRLGVRWVDTVAAIGARLEPDPVVSVIGWAVLVAVVITLVAAHRAGAQPGQPGG